MHKMEFILSDGTKIVRVNRRVAMSLFEAGKPVYLCACKMQPGPPWSPEAQLKKKSEDETFESSTKVKALLLAQTTSWPPTITGSSSTVSDLPMTASELSTSAPLTIF